MVAMSHVNSVQDRQAAHRHAEGQARHGIASDVDRRRHLSPFQRHFLEMLGAMAVGMIATGAIFLSVVGLKTWDQVTFRYPTQALVAMAVGMTLPMVGWMFYRGMGLRNSVEMALAMVLPVLPFLCLVWFGVTESAQCGAYCIVMVIVMYVLMRYRRSEYSTHSMHAM
jgi:hypothetical protein